MDHQSTEVQTATNSLWAQRAIEQRLLDAVELAEVLAMVGAHQEDVAQVELAIILENRFSESPERLEQLLAVLDGSASKPLTGESNAIEGNDAQLETEPDVSVSSSTAGTVDTEADDVTRHAGQRNSRSRRSESPSGSAAAIIAQRATDSGEASPERLSEPEPIKTAIDRLSSATRQKLSSIYQGADRYVKTEEVGRGGCGIVEKARDRQLDRDVVVKRIVDKYSSHDEVVERFINEARITGQLEHPGIVPVYELGVDAAGVPYYAMKQVRGVTLAAKIKELHAVEDPRLFKQQLSQILQRFLDVCQTLAFAHQAGVIHRDLKPANVMIGEFGETILLDWGLARSLRSEQGASDDDPNEQTLVAGKSNSNRRTGNSRSSTETARRDMTQQGMVLGTAAYMAPEQAMGLNDRVNKQSDVFALGVILYEILSGVSPFRSDSLETTMRRVVQCDYRPLSKLRRGLPKLPRPLLAICENAMQREQALRYIDARELATDLQSFLTGGAVSVYRESLWERLDRTAERHRVVVRAVFMACLLVTAVSLVAVAKVTRSHEAERVARLQAVEAHAAAHAALLAEREAREQTQEQLIASREAADAWLIGLSGDLQFYPGLDGLRQSLISQARVHYDNLLHVAEEQLAKTPDGEPTQGKMREDWIHAVTEVAACRLRLGDLLRLSGDTNSALTHYQTSIDILEKATAGREELATDGLKLQIANATIGQAMIELEQIKTSTSASESNQVATDVISSATVQKAIDIANDLLRRDPGLSEARNTLARALVIDARSMAEGGEPQASLDRLDRALATVNILSEQADSVKAQKLKRTILEDRARILYRAGDNVGASNACHELIRFLDHLHGLYPNRPDLLEGRALANSLLAATKINGANPSEAVAACEASETDLDSAWELLFGESFYRENQAVLAANVAAALEMLGQPAQAIDSWRASIDELRLLLQTDGVNNHRVRNMANSYLSLASLLVDDAGAQVEVKQLLEQCNVLLAHLAEQHDEDFTELQLRQYLLHAEVELQSGEFVAAEEQLSAVETNLDAFVASHTGLARGLIEVQVNLLRKKLAILREPHVRIGASWIASDELKALPLAQHKAYAGMLELWAVQRQIPSGVDEAAVAQRLALDWTAAHPLSPEAWSWLATWSASTKDWETAERARTKSMQLRQGVACVDDELVRAMIALQQDAAWGEPLMSAAVARASQESSTTARRQLLRGLLSDFAKPK